MTELIIMFIVFGWVSLMLTSSGRTARKKGPVPKMKNPPPPPLKKGNCYLDCGNPRPSPGPDVICLNCGSSIIK